MVNDQISDMIIRIKNSAMVGKKTADIPYSKMKFEIAKILKKVGFIEGFVKKGKGVERLIEILLKYNEDGSSKITDLKRVSTPGRRVYSLAKNLKSVRQGVGMSIISTPKGLMNNSEAKRNNLGGEILFVIW